MIGLTNQFLIKGINLQLFKEVSFYLALYNASVNFSPAPLMFPFVDQELLKICTFSKSTLLFNMFTIQDFPFLKKAEAQPLKAFATNTVSLKLNYCISGDLNISFFVVLV